MLKFLAGVFIGFVLGTTYPEETRSFVKMAISKAMHLLQNVEKDLGDKQPRYKNTPSYDEDYKPLYDNSRNSGYSESSF